MKQKDNYDKLRGGYYTPESIVNFILKWAEIDDNDTILEPSCGDGAFLKGLKNINPNFNSKNIDAIELDGNEAKKAERNGFDIINSDFFTYYKDNINNKKEYNLVIGNPPFIRYQNFDEKYRKIAFELMEEKGFKSSKLTNIWMPFLILSSQALSENGKLGMVIPAELFQVDYAAKARLFLSNFFENITLITFSQLVFEDIQQEVIILLAKRKSVKKGIAILELDNLKPLDENINTLLKKAEYKDLDHSEDKWVRYYLSKKEFNFLKMVENDERISLATNLFEINVGLVSGENDFFLYDKDHLEKFSLQNFSKPIIGRTEQLKGIELTKNDFSELQNNGKKVYFFEPEDKDFEELTDLEKNYIKWGEENNFNTNYKCRIRKRWYIVPKSWTADAFIVRQGNLYPRIILNSKKAYVTDTLHKLKFKNKNQSKQITASFLNSFTLALCETLGRSYGGGVITFEPGEIRKIKIPLINSEKIDFKYIDSLQREKNIDLILDYNDKILLHDGLGYTDEQILMLRNIWKKMRDRRLSRKKTKN